MLAITRVSPSPFPPFLVSSGALPVPIQSHASPSSSAARTHSRGTVAVQRVSQHGSPAGLRTHRGLAFSAERPRRLGRDTSYRHVQPPGGSVSSCRHVRSPSTRFRPGPRERARLSPRRHTHTRATGVLARAARTQRAPPRSPQRGRVRPPPKLLTFARYRPSQQRGQYSLGRSTRRRRPRTTW